MKFKLSTVSLTAGLLSLTALATFANDAPVVDIQEQQDNGAVSTQPEHASGDGWQVVSNGNNNGSKNDAHHTVTAQNNQNNQNSSDDDNWQPVHDQNQNHESSNSDAPVNQRVSRLEQQVSNYNQMNLPQQISDLQQKISQLQGQLEVDQHTIKTLQDQQKLYYQDTQQQLGQLQKSGATGNADKSSLVKNDADEPQTEFASKTSHTATMVMHKKKEQPKTVAQKTDPEPAKTDNNTTNTAAAASQTDIVDGQNLLAKNGTTLSDADLYDKAFHALSNKDFKGAQAGFQNYLSNYPKGRFAVSAHFWLGEMNLMHEKYDGALKEFQTVVLQYPDSNKVADAKLKIAMIHAATGKMDVARQEFTQIRKAYPGTTAAQLANIRLQQLANATSVSVQ